MQQIFPGTSAPPPVIFLECFGVEGCFGGAISHITTAMHQNPVGTAHALRLSLPRQVASWWCTSTELCIDQSQPGTSIRLGRHQVRLRPLRSSKRGGRQREWPCLGIPFSGTVQELLPAHCQDTFTKHPLLLEDVEDEDRPELRLWVTGIGEEEARGTEEMWHNGLFMYSVCLRCSEAGRGGGGMVALEGELFGGILKRAEACNAAKIVVLKDHLYISHPKAAVTEISAAWQYTPAARAVLCHNKTGNAGVQCATTCRLTGNCC